MQESLEPPSDPVELVLAGVDEAGLGPLLGSLAIGYSVLAVPASEPDPWKCLRGTVARSPLAKKRLIVADSKLLFRRNAKGARRLEATALSFLSAGERVGPLPCPAMQLFCGTLGPDRRIVRAHPWYEHLGQLPRHNPPETIELSAALLARALARSGVTLLDAGVRIVPAGELNASYAETANKALSVWTKVLEILRHLWNTHRARRLRVTVDMLGGRRRYGALLARAFPEASVSLLEERLGRSAYRLEARARPEDPEGGEGMELDFRVQADRECFPVALASCLAKYARELEMDAFNAYFAELAPELRPTAGYRQDGARWLAEAGAAIAKSGLAPEVLVRTR